MSTEVTRHNPGGFELLVELERLGALSETSLDLGSREISYDTFEALATMLGRVKRTCSWLIGDLINWGEKLYGDDRYVQAAHLTGLAEDTLIVYTSVCRRVPRARRHPALSFGHHAAVAKLSPAEQTAWLDTAEANDWSRSQLRQALGAPPPEQPQWTPIPKETEPPPPAPTNTAAAAPGTPLTRLDAQIEVLPLPSTTGLLEAARRVIAASRPISNGWIVPADAFAELVALAA